MKTVALIPAFNEQRTIAAVVTGVRPHVDHVVVVDDGSSDETAADARAAMAEVLELRPNAGKGMAIRAG